MKEYFLTLRSNRPNKQAVTVDRERENGCMRVRTIYLRCESELNGNYTWDQETRETNYVLFVLNRKAEIDEISLTYVVPGTERPKVSFCALSDGTLINGTLSNENCIKVDIQQTDGMRLMVNLTMPFNNITTSIVSMEVITQGIKAAFIATGVQFLGRYDVTGIPINHSSINSTQAKR